jgi:hypothetical protein
VTDHQILFDRLAYIDRLTRAGIGEDHARAHAEAIDEALRDAVATKSDLARVEVSLTNKIEIAVRDVTIRIGGMLIVAVGVLIGIKFFG